MARPSQLKRRPKRRPDDGGFDWTNAFERLGEQVGRAVFDRIEEAVEKKLKKGGPGLGGAVPPRNGAGNDPYAVLGMQAGEDLEVYEAVYKAKAKKLHPDRGGDPEAMKRLNAAMKCIREELRK